MKTILATTSSFGSVCAESVSLLKAAGYQVEINPHGRKLTELELSEQLKLYKPVGLLAGTEPVTDFVLREAASHLKAVSRVGVGWDNVDHEAALALGISVARTEGVLDQAVAELTLGMMLDALRKVSRHDREMRSGVWKKHLGSLLSTKTVGVIGYGAIGRRVAQLCRAFGATVVFSDVMDIPTVSDRQCSLHELLVAADIVTLHASGADPIIGASQLDYCREGVILVNTARGGLIDESSLVERLEDGRVGHVCLDVFESEPYGGPLVHLDNVTLTSHVGSYAVESRIEMEIKAVKNLLQALREGNDR